MASNYVFFRFVSQKKEKKRKNGKWEGNRIKITIMKLTKQFNSI